MKKNVLRMTLLVSALAANAQTRSLNLELLGSSGMVGVNYDARFKNNWGWGYSIGLGYGLSGHSDLSGYKSFSHIMGVPVEMNYLFGKKNSHLVLGAGVMSGVDLNHTHLPASTIFYEDGTCDIMEESDSHTTKWGFAPFADIAFRIQKPNGFAFSIGVKPNLDAAFWPYITFGKSF